MRSSLNRTLLWAGIVIVLQDEGGFAQPINLLPQGDAAEVESPQVQVPTSPLQESTEFWEGTPPSVIEQYFPKLPVNLTSPVLRGLRAQLGKEKYTPLLSNPAYEQSLLSLFMAEGGGEQTKEFLLETNLPDKDSLFLDIQWLEGNSKQACEKITNLIRTVSNIEWKKQNIYCLYLNGEKERAKIAVEVLGESNPSAAQLLDTLFDPSIKLPLDESITKSPFLLTVWLETHQDIPEEELENLPPSFLAMIARSAKASFPTRFKAAEKALQRGTFAAEEFVARLKESPPIGLWGKLIEELKSPKTERLLPLFEQAAQERKLGLIGQTMSSSLSNIEPSAENISLAPFMVQMFLQGGRKELAKKWGTFFMGEAPDEAVAILPLLHFAFPETKWGETQIQAWQAYESRVHPKTASQHSYEIRRLLEAFGELAGQPMKGEPSPPSWRQEKALFDEQALSLLESAAESQRRGEVLLLVLVIIGEKPLYEVSVDKIVPLLKALNKAGLKEEARLLGLDFLLENINLG